jgi:Xaa-Pro aminopeptidase
MKTTLLKNLQQALVTQGLDAYLLPKTDPHRCEYGLPEDDMLPPLSGFTGSMGFIIILRDKAFLLTDGRYTLQASQEVDPSLWTVVLYGREAIFDLLKQHLGPQSRIAFDSLLWTSQEKAPYDQLCTEQGFEAVTLDQPLLTTVWANRPERSLFNVENHPVSYAGESVEDKIHRLGQALADARAQGLFLNAPEALAWLLNLRSPDRPLNPASSGFAYVLHTGKIHLFMDSLNPDGWPSHLPAQVTVHPYDQAYQDVPLTSGERLWIDPAEIPLFFEHFFQEKGLSLLKKTNPLLLMRACKNKTEIAGATQAHIRDGAALCDAFAHLYATQGQGMTELDVVALLEQHRQRQDLFVSPSFNSIVGVEAHGAIIHYRPLPETNWRLRPDSLLLIDSGGQYRDGTTDITRTLRLDGKPTAEEKRFYTWVLKGHIALGVQRFPEGTSGSQLDALARQFLWQEGFDYGHGTGHGVGSFLAVHEGPQRISGLPNTIALAPGMMLSNEPGYYRNNAFGIRIENLVYVTPRPQPQDERTMLGFETLTLVPYDRALIDLDLLAPSEHAWIDSYHKRVWTIQKDRVLPQTVSWLEQFTRPLTS